MLITTLTLAEELSCTPQTVNKYRRKAETKAGKTFGRKDETDRRIIVFTEDEAALIREMAPQRVTPDPVSVEAEALYEAKEPPAPRSLPIRRSLLGLKSPVAPEAQVVLFDADDASLDRASLLQHEARSVAAADKTLSAYARYRMSEAVATIDQTIETMTANALAAAGAQAGKEVEAASH